ncbi:MAG: hypothetical protein Q9P14_12765 [candidate division KSB1 bacterium]|nr:hypothetical protein [candidate division KSB1 bacterium]MDQ7065843.1 hypothetical protein [candidate division KSB1 bacterium]
MKRMVFVTGLLLVGLAACWSQNDAKRAPKAQSSLQEITGRIYLGGTETYSFIGLQLLSGRAIVLLGADSLRHYQNRMARVRGQFLHADSDSFLVKQVNLLHKP